MFASSHGPAAIVLHRDRRDDPEAARVEFAEALRVYRLRDRRSSVEKLQKKLAASR